MSWFGSKKTVAGLPVISFSEVKKRTRIVVIDDDPNSFPIEILKKEGYAIDYWEDVEELSKLEEGAYDIIFLDIQGVGKDYSDEEGLGILEHLKNKNPSQIVVAFSCHSFDLSKNRFWKLADDSLCKPVQAAKCKQLIDELIKNKHNPKHYWSSVSQLLIHQGYSQKKIGKLENQICRAIENKNTHEIQNIISSCVDKTEIGLKIVGVVAKIVSLIA